MTATKFKRLVKLAQFLCASSFLCTVGAHAEDVIKIGIPVSSVRLKVEQHQLVVGGGWNSLVSVGLEGAC